MLGHLHLSIFDVGNVSSPRNTTVRVRGNCRYHQLWNNSRDRTDVNRRKCGRYNARFAEFRWTIRVVWTVAGNVFDVGNVSSLRKTMARVRGNCRCRQSWSMSPPSPFHNFAENQQFCTFILPSILRSSISHFALYQHPPPDGSARKTSH